MNTVVDPCRTVPTAAEVEAKNRRWREFASLPEARGRERTAIQLADSTNLTIEEARKVLRATPLDEDAGRA